MDTVAHDDLRRQSLRMTRGYLLALLVIGVTSIVTYVTLKNTLRQQQHLNQLQIVSANLQLALRDTFDRAEDLKNELRGNSSNQRLTLQIKRRVRSELDQLIELHADASNSVALLSRSGNTQSVSKLFYNAPFSLNQRIQAFSDLIESMLVDTDATPADSTLFWLPVDATAAEGGFLSRGYRLASEKTQVLLNDHNKQIEVTQRRLSILIGGVLLMVTFLIFRPLTVGLQQVTERVLKAQSELEYLAFHDPVSGLCNARGAEQRSEHYTCLLVIRIRNLTAISNVVGAADEVRFLESFAGRLKEVTRSSDLIARTGDDEFAVLTESDLANDGVDLCHQIHDRTRRLVVSNIPVFVDTGMGWDVLSTGEFSGHLANARLAERAFQPQVSFVPRFNPSFRAELEKENQMADRIRNAIADSRFTPFYQLKVNTTDWQPDGMEALCRWVEPDGNIISPGEFIPVAERKGLIVDITWQQIRQVIVDQMKWKDSGLYSGAVAVNCAEAVLRDQEFSKKFKQVFVGYEKPWELIEMEITENVALSDSFQDIEKSLAIIRGAGISIALDDFGTGFASLSSVVDLDIDVVKIDRSFVADMMQNKKSRVVVEGILSICKTLNKKSVIEGVEDSDQAELLKVLGADQIQGFYFHRPSPFDEVVKTLESWSAHLAA